MKSLQDLGSAAESSGETTRFFPKTTRDFGGSARDSSRNALLAKQTNGMESRRQPEAPGHSHQAIGTGPRAAGHEWKTGGKQGMVAGDNLSIHNLE